MIHYDANINNRIHGIGSSKVFCTNSIRKSAIDAEYFSKYTLKTESDMNEHTQSFEDQESAESVARFYSRKNQYASPEKVGIFWVVRVWDMNGFSWYA